MTDMSHDFEVLAERADDYGALWAARTFRRFLSGSQSLPDRWPGTLGEARRVVATFATRAGFVDRERLASIVLCAAETTWAARE
ncbi:MAG TPA: hypothetical protein VK540_34435 [Polyangiaceae bacterium]|jgi:hypothetical protein|nr:hypothetical protein [Polyangiaceae bacterium]